MYGIVCMCACYIPQYISEVRGSLPVRYYLSYFQFFCNDSSCFLLKMATRSYCGIARLIFWRYAKFSIVKLDALCIC